MNISNNAIYLQDNDVYILTDQNINFVSDVYILIEHMLTEWKIEEYNKIINDITANREYLFNFFNFILNEIGNIFILDKKYKPMYYIKVNDASIDALVKTYIK